MERRWLQTNAEALKPLVQHTVEAAINRQFGARDCANVAYGAAGVWQSFGVEKSVGFQTSLSELFTAMAKEAVTKNTFTLNGVFSDDHPPH